MNFKYFLHFLQRPIVSFSIEDRAVHNIKMKRMLKSQQKNPLFKNKNAKNGDAAVDIKPNAKKLKKMEKSAKKQQTEENGDNLAEFVGATAEQGSKYKFRPQWKLREDNATHSKTVKQKKKMVKKQKQMKEIRAEKRQIERPKQGKRNPKDVDSSLVNKYLKRLHAQDDSQPKPKRSKWYVE